MRFKYILILFKSKYLDIKVTLLLTPGMNNAESRQNICVGGGGVANISIETALYYLCTLDLCQNLDFTYSNTFRLKFQYRNISFFKTI